MKERVLHDRDHERMLLALAVLAHLSNIDLIARCTADTDASCAVQLGATMAKPLRLGVDRLAAPLRPFLATPLGSAIFEEIWRVNQLMPPYL